MTLTDDLRAMFASALGCTATGPDGAIVGMYDREETEQSGFTDLPGNLSRLNRLTVFRLATADLGTIARGATLTIAAQDTHPVAQSYQVRDSRDEDDGLVTKLLLVKAS